MMNSTLEHSAPMVNPALLNSGFMAVFSSSLGLLSDGLQFQKIHMLQPVKVTNVDLTDSREKMATVTQLKLQCTIYKERGTYMYE